MVLTFRSTTPETKIVVDRAADGRQRVGRAVQSGHNPKFWNITIENPSGSGTTATFHGSGMEAVVAIADLMNRSANEYAQDRARGDRPRQPAFDANRSVDGDAPPILGYSKR